MQLYSPLSYDTKSLSYGDNTNYQCKFILFSVPSCRTIISSSKLKCQNQWILWILIKILSNTFAVVTGFHKRDKLLFAAKLDW